jgi:hypothetical protein
MKIISNTITGRSAVLGMGVKWKYGLLSHKKIVLLRKYQVRQPTYISNIGLCHAINSNVLSMGHAYSYYTFLNVAVMWSQVDELWHTCLCHAVNHQNGDHGDIIICMNNKLLSPFWWFNLWTINRESKYMSVSGTSIGKFNFVCNIQVDELWHTCLCHAVNHQNGDHEHWITTPNRLCCCISCYDTCYSNFLYRTHRENVRIWN